MIDVAKAIMIFRKNAPNKKILSISEWNGKYVFGSRDKRLKEDEPDYDSTFEVVDKTNGDFSTMDGFNLDFMANAKPINWTGKEIEKL